MRRTGFILSKARLGHSTGFDTNGMVCAMITKGTFFVTSGLDIPHTTLYEKRFYFRMKEFAPMGSQFISFRVGSFSSGDKTTLTEISPLKVYPLHLSLVLLNKIRCYAHF